MVSKKELIQILLDQKDLKWNDTYISRFTNLGIDASSELITIISGIRRCGKSVLLQEIRNNEDEKDYFLNFDDDRLINFKVDDFQLLYETLIELYGLQTTFYFDEIQNIKGWERFIRRLFDYGNKIFVTGSNANMLSKELGTHLTGRYQLVELFPFSFKEFLKASKFKLNIQNVYSTKEKSLLVKKYNEYFSLGGFPYYIVHQNKDYLKILTDNILYRDVMVRNKILKENEIFELIRFTSSNVSKPITYNSLRKVINVKQAATVRQYLQYIENTYLIFLVNKFDYSLKNQMYNPKKVYYIDNAIAILNGFHFSEDRGRLLENQVYIALRRLGKEIFYHNVAKECDFVVFEKNKVVEAIQVTSSLSDEKTRKRETEGLIDALKTHDLDEGLILTEYEENKLFVQGKKINILPVWKWMLVVKDGVM